MDLDLGVFALAADLLEHRGLLRTAATECGIWYAHQLVASDTRRKRGRSSTVGAVASACVHRDCIVDEVRYLAHLRGWAGVRIVPLVEDGRTGPEIVALLRACAAADLTPNRSV